MNQSPSKPSSIFAVSGSEGRVMFASMILPSLSNKIKRGIVVIV